MITIQAINEAGEVVYSRHVEPSRLDWILIGLRQNTSIAAIFVDGVAQ